MRSLLGLSLFFTTILPAQSRAQEPLKLTFGVYTSDRAAVMFSKFAPVLKSLSTDIGQRTQRPTTVRLRIFRTYAGARRALVRGSIDLARFGAASYCLAVKDEPDLELLAMEAKKGGRSFKGYIVVQTDSAVRSLADLRGKSFAFGSEFSTVGRYLSQQRLMSEGLRDKDFRRTAYLGRHDRVFRAVQAGEFIAGALKSGTFKKLNTKGQLRVLDSFDVPTKPWVARAGLQPAVREALRESLLGMTSPHALKALKASGFVKTSPEYFAEVARSLSAAEAFAPPKAKPAK